MRKENESEREQVLMIAQRMFVMVKCSTVPVQFQKVDLVASLIEYALIVNVCRQKNAYVLQYHWQICLVECLSRSESSINQTKEKSFNNQKTENSV